MDAASQRSAPAFPKCGRSAIVVDVLQWTIRTYAIGSLIVMACQFDSAGSGASHGAGGGSGTESETVTAEGTRTDGTDTVGDASGSASTTTTTGTATMTVTGDHGESTAGELEGTATETTDAQPLCDRALMVTADIDLENNVDTPLYHRLLELGFIVTPVDKVASGPEDVADNCVVIISDIGSSGDVNTKFLDAAVGVVILEPGLYDDMRLVAESGDIWWGDGHDHIEIVDPSHPLAAGLDGTVAIYDGGGRGNWGRPVPSAQVVAIWPDTPDQATLMGYETGAQMAHGFIAPARRVGFPGGVTSVPMTPARIDLFEAAVRWAAGDLP
jgi:hypothetical protein